MDAQSPSINLQDMVALVTGGSRGIGRAVVELLVTTGAKVVVNYVNDKEAAESLVNSATARGGEGVSVKADVSKAADAEKLVQATLEHFGRLDILVCCAGIWEGELLEDLTEQLWDKSIEVNLKGTYTVCHAAVPVMKKKRAGKIVIVSSTAGQRGEAGYSNYAASKGGQIAFVKSLASELGEFNINVNAVAPGWVDTDMTKDALGDEAQKSSIARGIPIGRIATPDDIARPIVFLCSDWAAHITGEVLNVNGGSVLCG